MSLLKQNHMALEPRPPGAEMCDLGERILAPCQEPAALANTEGLASSPDDEISSYIFGSSVTISVALQTKWLPT